jgi:hypothetical protein
MTKPVIPVIGDGGFFIVPLRDGCDLMDVIG